MFNGSRVHQHVMIFVQSCDSRFWKTPQNDVTWAWLLGHTSSAARRPPFYPCCAAAAGAELYGSGKIASKYRTFFKKLAPGQASTYVLRKLMENFVRFLTRFWRGHQNTTRKKFLGKITWKNCNRWLKLILKGTPLNCKNIMSTTGVISSSFL